MSTDKIVHFSSHHSLVSRPYSIIFPTIFDFSVHFQPEPSSNNAFNAITSEIAKYNLPIVSHPTSLISYWCSDTID